MSRSITLEIPETEAVSIESALDEALVALRQMEADTGAEREDRVMRLRAETHVLLEQIRAQMHVEETV